MTYRINQRARANLTVTNSDGNVVRQVAVGRQSAGRHSMSWNGRDNAGNLVPVGSYRMKVSATSAFGVTRTGTAAVKLATAVVTRTATKAKWGDSGQAATSGRCQVRWDTHAGSATLDCWGGSYAKVSYPFKLPKSATDVRWSVYGGKRETPWRSFPPHQRPRPRKAQPRGSQAKPGLTSWPHHRSRPEWSSAPALRPRLGTFWHGHGKGPTLHVTEGVAWVGTRAAASSSCGPLQTVWTPPGEWQWHGATAGAFMTHLAISETADPTDSRHHAARGHRVGWAGDRRPVPGAPTTTPTPASSESDRRPSISQSPEPTAASA